VVIGELLRLATHLVFLYRLGERDEALGTGLEGAAAAQRIGLVGYAAAWDRLTMQPVALIVVHLGERRVDRYLVEVGAAQARDLRVDVGVDTAGQERIVAEVD